MSLQIDEVEVDGVAFPGEPVDVTAEFNSGVAPFDVTVDWGDGQSCPGAGSCFVDPMEDLMPGIVDAEYVYSEPGSYDVTVTISDATGAQFVATVSTESCTIVGTQGRDVLNGTAGDDVICGLGGNDRIFGLGGNDTIIGGSGRDRIDAGAGDDVVYGGREPDQIYGRVGADDIRGGSGNDVIRGGDGDDLIKGRLGSDRIFGENGDDTLVGNRGNDNLDGGNGDDTLKGRRGSDRLNGRADDDNLAGGQGRDVLTGAQGQDALNGGTGADNLAGGVGDDILDGGLGVDRANGGPGEDVCLAEQTLACEDDGSGLGEVEVEINTPDGVAANVELSGATADYLAAKPDGATDFEVVIEVAPGTYQVTARPVIVDGYSYVATTSAEEVEAKTGERSIVAVTYAAAEGGNRLYASNVEPTVVGLAWAGPSEITYLLRRTEGSEPAQSPDQGVAVSVTGQTATDDGLAAGSEYTYALFSMLDDGQIIGPHWITVGTTAAADDGSNVEYVKSADAAFPQPAEVGQVELLGGSIRVALASDVATPTLGSGVVLPRSATLPGGFVGEVTAVEPDGKLMLTPAGVSLVVDYYDLSVPSIRDANAAGIDGQGEFATTAGRESEVSTRAAQLVNCLGGEFGAEVLEIDPTLDPGGSFDLEIDKTKIWFVEVPVEVRVDLDVSLTFGASATAEFSGAVQCQADLDALRIFTNIGSIGPVPISLDFTPKVEASASGAIQVEDLGFQAVVGFEADASLSLSDTSFEGGPYSDGMILSPDITGWSGTFQMKVGGSLTVGPGAGSKTGGVIAGVNGTLFPLDASVSLFDTDNTDLCVEAVAGMSGSLGFLAKAWLWKLEAEISWPILDGNLLTYAGPVIVPTGCDDPEEPEDTVFGPGVTPIDNEVVGGPEQVGYVDGFVPGERTWVLSTGLISEAVGIPSFFASTILGYPGDDALSQAAGYETFDAVRFSATVVPEADTLFVRYVFASEEYPEYVGSQFNDVMEVRVDGQLCSIVPGTDLPVAINNVNQATNSEYFVDNQAGASGYGTTMDGLTVPLTCSVPVTPGEEVLVTIAVADASDGIYDSAVALIDGGIWSE